jgi:Fe-S-cluster containining protein
VSLDCRSCGACCTNPDENAREGRLDYVPVEAGARLLSRRDLLRKHVTTQDGIGPPHLRLSADGRCSALRGAIGRKVACAIYHLRPAACRRVQPGDGDCLRARAERGVVTLLRRWV